jgi:hypothetical protein
VCEHVRGFGQLSVSVCVRVGGWVGGGGAPGPATIQLPKLLDTGRCVGWCADNHDGYARDGTAPSSAPTCGGPGAPAAAEGVLVASPGAP